MSADANEDVAALRAAAAGDKRAFHGLVARHRGAVFRFACALVKDTAAAEDVLQEAFVAAYRRAGTYRGEGSVRGWLLTIARRQALTALRRRSGEPARMASLETLGAEAGWGREPPCSMQQLVDRQALQVALSGLEAAEREVILLRDIEGLSGDETAAVLDLSVPAMKSRLHRARLRLAAALIEGGFDGARS